VQPPQTVNTIIWDRNRTWKKCKCAKNTIIVCLQWSLHLIRVSLASSLTQSLGKEKSNRSELIQSGRPSCGQLSKIRHDTKCDTKAR